ncbi:hypothetical protein [Amycolatopsis thermoflava]|uniref:hypothetical protein n=1 Tax=Amycolatopsis thermoflava TaxID=84480 RepID=UPI003F49C202
MIRIETEQLVKLLGDLVHTAAAGLGPTSGILLHTTRGPLEDEPGETDLLVGTSTDGFAIGHTYVDAYGQLARPMLWPLGDVRAVLAAFKPKAASTKGKPQKHTVLIGREDDVIVVREDPNLFSDGLTVRFSEGPVAEYPRSLWGAIAEPPRLPDDWSPTQPRTDFYDAALRPFLAVSKSRGEPIELYRYHQQSRCLVQIGGRYRGSILPNRVWVDRDPKAGDAPSSDVHAPAFPDDEE